jgi:hypothetical protein
MELNLDWRRHASALWPEVSYELRPLRVWAYHELLAFWQECGAGGAGSGAVKLTPAQGAGLMAVAKRILPEHVRELQGVVLVRDGARQPAAVEALCEEAALMPLAGEIVSRLVGLTEVPPAAEKN